MSNGFRTYEVYQRQRVGESTAKLKPRQLLSEEFVRDPYPLLAILRDNYPCYRDWIGNSFWITRYDDVTSVFMDDPNYETRPRRWFLGLDDGWGRDLGQELPVLQAEAASIDANAATLAAAIVADFAARGSADLARDFAPRFAIELLARTLDLPGADVPTFAALYWRMQRGANWDVQARQQGLGAAEALAEHIRPLLDKRRTDPGEDVLSVLAGLDATAEDVVVTLLEGDHETLHGALANMWFLLLTHPDQLDHVRNERRLVRYAYLETLRHSTPVLAARRFARHEVERFGRILPEGALLICSAAAGNRDPRAFVEPERFIVGRKDLCQREPRGTYRADGLPAGITFGLGRPSRHPALPEDRPRSHYAITRDVAVIASNALLDALPDLRLAPGAKPELRSLRLGEVHTCWHLPIEFTPTGPPGP